VRANVAYGSPQILDRDLLRRKGIERDEIQVFVQPEAEQLRSARGGYMKQVGLVP
jgi:hypothetical protein